MAKNLTVTFYGLIGLAASLTLFLILYWSLTLNSSITNIIINTRDTPSYFWSYSLLTLGTIILFGINAALFVFRIRKYGFPKITKQGGTGLGALVGIAASSCPACGSIILSSIGIAGGLAAFPFQGIELKALSFSFMALPVWLTMKDLNNKGCEGNYCPVPADASFKNTDRSWFFVLLALVIILGFVSWNKLVSEPLIAKFLSV